MPALVTTSRNPCDRSRSLARELAKALQDAKLFPRGEANTEKLAEKARENGLARVIIITDSKGNPGELRFIEVTESSWDWMKTIVLKSVKLAVEFTKPEPVEEERDEEIAELFDSEEVLANKKRITFAVEENEVGPRLVIECLK